MKKRLQLVALLLCLTLSTQPAFSASPCAAISCGDHPAMACCPPSGNAAMSMPMGMDCGHPTASAPVRCADQTCCTISPSTVVAPTPPVLVNPISSVVSILPSTLQTPAEPATIHRPPGPRRALPTARYVLFRDFRI